MDWTWNDALLFRIISTGHNGNTCYAAIAKQYDRYFVCIASKDSSREYDCLSADINRKFTRQVANLSWRVRTGIYIAVTEKTSLCNVVDSNSFGFIYYMPSI